LRQGLWVFLKYSKSVINDQFAKRRASAMTRSLAFLVLAHDDIEHLLRLAKRLAPYPVYAHVDAKLPADLTALRGCANLRLIEPRIAVHWAEFSVVGATLALIKASQFNGGAQHTVLLSGHCYPMRPVEALAEWLAAHPNNDFIQMVRIGPGSPINNNVGRHWRNAPLLPDRLLGLPSVAKCERLGRRIYNRVAREFPRDIYSELAPHSLFQGSQWWALTAESLTEIMAIALREPHWQEVFRTTHAPDELFFHTILGSSRRYGNQIGSTVDCGHENLYDAPLHYVARTVERWVMNDCDEQRQKLLNSDKFFVRKIGSRHRSLLDWIDDQATCNTTLPKYGTS
jgi:hypothetical protein